MNVKSIYSLSLFILLSSLILTGIFISDCCNAKDFGTLGNTYEIIEEDILKVIEKRLVKIDLEKLNKKMVERTKEYAERPTPVKGITKAKESREFLYDPSYVLEKDIRDDKGTIIHLAGATVNPLEFIPLRENLFFIDGDDEAQVKLALELRKKQKDKIKIILTSGSPLALQRKHKIWIFFDQAGYITNKFGIKEVPALVSQESLRLKITIMGEKD